MRKRTAGLKGPVTPQDAAATSGDVAGRSLEACAAVLATLPADLAPGHRALEELEAYMAHGLPVPLEVLQAIEEAYERFKYTRPLAGWTATEEPVPTSLGQAFGVPDHDGRQSLNRRRQVDYAAKVANAFEVLGVKRGPAGLRAVAAALGLTVAQVNKLLPRARAWSRGHKLQRPDSTAGLRAHDWFKSR